MENKNEQLEIKEQEELNEAPKEEESSEEKVELLTLESIEEKRLNFQAALKRAQTRSKIFIGITVLLLIGVFTGMLTGILLISYICAGVAVLAMVISFILNRRFERPDLNTYLYNYLQYVSNCYFGGPDFEDVSYDRKVKLEKNEVLLDNLYLDTVDVHSRGFNFGKYHGHSFNECECDVIVKGQKKGPNQVAFLGRRIFLMGNTHFEGKLVIVIKGSQDIDRPTNFEGLSILEEKDNYVIYGTSDAKLSEILNKDFYRLMKEIDHSKKILNINIALSATRSIAYISYEEEATNFPVDSPVNQELIDNCRKDILSTLELLETLEK